MKIADFDFVATNIMWDVDGDKKTKRAVLKSLPKKIDVPLDIFDDEDFDRVFDDEDDVELYVEDMISDYISDVTGFCHDGFYIEMRKSKKAACM